MTNPLHLFDGTFYDGLCIYFEANSLKEFASKNIHLIRHLLTKNDLDITAHPKSFANYISWKRSNPEQCAFLNKKFQFESDEATEILTFINSMFVVTAKDDLREVTDRRSFVLDVLCNLFLNAPGTYTET